MAEGQPIALMGFRPAVRSASRRSRTAHRRFGDDDRAARADRRATGLRARWPACAPGNTEVLQLDATAYPGNSGGPVLDAETGAVVAVVNMVAVRGSRETALSAPTGITYAIPVRSLRALIEEARSAPR
ncbi:MAG: trypsin-like peptidase domain-containing protein [Rubrivivax sp.]